MSRFFASIAALCFVFAGCRNDADDGDDVPEVDASVNGMTIQDVQSETMPPETAVSLSGVVVVAIDTYGARVGNFYVMEPGGGEYSGVLVYGAPTDQVAALVVGDLVDITGAKKDEFSLTEDDSTVTELISESAGSLMVVKVGAGTVPAPQVVDALAIGQMPKAAREAEYEKWEGVLVRVNSVSVLNNPAPIGSSDPTFLGFGITGSYEVDSTLSALPEVARGDCLASVTGMGDYFFDYKIMPRSSGDVVTGGSGCPADEAGASACADEIDNDADGFADCEDFSCSLDCAASVTVASVQNGTSAVGSIVSLTNVVVTAVSSDRKNLWVADSGTGMPNNGIQVYRRTTDALPTGVVVGAYANVTGTVAEFNNTDGTGTLTEITFPTITAGMSGTAALVAATPTVSDLINDTTGEPYEGVLVEIHDVKVVGMPTGTEHGVRYLASYGTATTQFESAIDISGTALVADTCYQTIKGIWSYNVYANRWTILPLGGADTVSGTCPL